MERTKIRIKIGFRYDVDAVVEAEPGWHDRVDVEAAKADAQSELDFIFCDDGRKGVISDFVLKAEEVEE